MPTNYHIPVLLEEVKQYLLEENTIIKDYDISQTVKIFDGTLGGGGYSKMILDHKPNIHVIASDLDPMAIENFWDFTALKKEEYQNRISFLQMSFTEAISKQKDKSLTGIVVDLGFSSNQMEFGGRGFAYLGKDPNEPFDLRFDPTIGLPAFEKIKALKSSKELGNIIYNYSGEKLAKKVGDYLFDFVRSTPRNSTVSLEQALGAITSAIPKQFQHKQNSILSRIWQALRIWINDELNLLSEFLPVALDKLSPGGRLVVVDFHSLEDKIVTNWMRKLAEPIKVDQYGQKTFLTKLKTRRGIEPSLDEVTRNPRSRSATLRCLEKC